MYRMTFTIEDLDINKKYDFIIEKLKYLTFFIELEEVKLLEHLLNLKPISSLDLIWSIGFYGYDKRKVDFWLDILDEHLDPRNYTDKEYDMYIDFQTVFEDECVKKAEEFESIISNKINWEAI